MSAYSKALVAALVAVAYAGLTAWQAATGDGFQVLDLLPLVAAVGAALLTYLVPNVPELPWAKAAVQLVLSVDAALATLFEHGTTGVTALAVCVTVAGALLTYVTPNRSGQPRDALGRFTTGHGQHEA